MLPIALGVLGVLIGGPWFGEWLGPGLAGVALGLTLALRQRVRTLEGEVSRLRRRDPSRESTQATAAPAPPDATPTAASAARESGASLVRDHWNEAATFDRSGPVSVPSPRPAVAAAAPDALTRTLARAWAWLLGENPMVRAGVVVLFFGIAFLLKLAADNALLPIELRLAGVGAGAAALLGIGWRLRHSRPFYALALQGGGVGALYLTVFAALRLYGLLAPGPAFALLSALALSSAVLAVLQEAPILAVLGAAGGFLAPVLASTGEGSHVALFSYYLVLNLGILGIAWFRAWRALNLTGFAFTFVIGALWGHGFYRPEHFASTEPFLVAFALLYVAVALLYALRQPAERRGRVDATLVLGVPLAGFALQAGLVRDLEYGLAWSALAAAAFYGSLAAWVLGRWHAELRLLGESFLAIGAVFATLAIPLALDARWTAGLWALEGAAMVWIGRRQGRLAPRVFGYLLQPAAALSLLQAVWEAPPDLPLVNGLFVGALVAAVSGLFAAWQIRRLAQAPAWERWLYPAFLAWGLVWWYGAWIVQIADQAGRGPGLVGALATCFAGSALLAERLRRRLDWDDLRLPGLALLPGLSLLLPLSAWLLERPFQGWALAGWAVALAVHLDLLHGEDRRARERSAALPAEVALMHRGGLWLILILVAWELAWRLDHWIQGATTWPLIAWALVPTAALAAIGRLSARLPWPVSAHPGLYRDQALAPVALFLWVWAIASCLGSPGASAPLPYLPLLNPLDLAVVLALVALADWVWNGRWRFALAPWGLGLGLFVWLNSAWLRTAHHWLELPFALAPLLQSQTVQAGLAILWALTGLSGMARGSRRGRRALWLAGAGLMGLAVLKLFLVDLAGSGTLARIVSFLSVGVLLLTVGYIAPLPPRGEREDGV